MGFSYVAQTRFELVIILCQPLRDSSFGNIILLHFLVNHSSTNHIWNLALLDTASSPGLSVVDSVSVGNSLLQS